LMFINRESFRFFPENLLFLPNKLFIAYKSICREYLTLALKSKIFPFLFRAGLALNCDYGLRAIIGYRNFPLAGFSERRKENTRILPENEILTNLLERCRFQPIIERIRYAPGSAVRFLCGSS